jgi:hypothetical protein
MPRPESIAGLSQPGTARGNARINRLLDRASLRPHFLRGRSEGRTWLDDRGRAPDAPVPAIATASTIHGNNGSRVNLRERNAGT